MSRDAAYSIRLMTTHQVAVHYGVHKMTIYRRVAAGLLVPFMRTDSGAMLFIADDIEGHELAAGNPVGRPRRG